jgi:hypothetical protein
MKTKLLNLVTGAALTIPLLIHISAYAEQEENDENMQQEPPNMPSESAVESQIEGILRHNPGSYQISPTEVQLSDGAVMTVAAKDVRGCPTNYLCLSRDADFGAPHLSFSDCNFPKNLSDYQMPDGGVWNDRVSSIRNAKRGGTAAFYNVDAAGVQRLVIAVNAGTYLRDLSKDPSAEGGNANDKIDTVHYPECPPRSELLGCPTSSLSLPWGNPALTHRYHRCAHLPSREESQDSPGSCS